MSPSFGDMILGGRADGPVLPLDGGVLRDFHLKHLWPQEEQLVWPHDSLQRPPEGLAGGAEALFSQTYHLLRVCGAPGVRTGIWARDVPRLSRSAPGGPCALGHQRESRRGSGRVC